MVSNQYLQNFYLINIYNKRKNQWYLLESNINYILRPHLIA